MALPLPMTATIEGVEVVIVAAADYGRMAANDAASAEPALQFGMDNPPVDRILRYMRTRPSRGLRFKVVFDDEVARFLIERMGKMAQTELVYACLDRFGEERSPSLNSFNRFQKAVQTWFEGISKGEIA